MASPYKAFGVEKALEQDGILLNYGDFRIRVARAGGGNSQFRRLLQARLKPYRHQLDNETMDESVSEGILRRCYAEAVILGWETKVSADPTPDGTWEPWLETPDGKTPYSVEACIKVLADLPELFRALQKAAGEASNFRKAEEEADAKN